MVSARSSAGTTDPDALAAYRDRGVRHVVEDDGGVLTGHSSARTRLRLATGPGAAQISTRRSCPSCDIEAMEPACAAGAAQRPRGSYTSASAPARKERASVRIRSVLHTLLGEHAGIHGLGPYSALKIVAECGTDMSRWRTAKHFTSWLTLAAGSKISGGKVLSARTRHLGEPSDGLAAHWRPSAVRRIGDRARCVLPAPRCPPRQGQGGHRDGTRNRGHPLQHDPTRRPSVDSGAYYYEERYTERPP